MTILKIYTFDVDLELPNWAKIVRDIMRLRKIGDIEDNTVFNFLPWGVIIHLDQLPGSLTEMHLNSTDWFSAILQRALEAGVYQIHINGDFNTSISDEDEIYFTLSDEARSVLPDKLN